MNDYAKNLLTDLASSALDEMRGRAYSYESEIAEGQRIQDMHIAVAALYEAKVQVGEIIRLMQKFYSVSESTAYEILRNEKVIEHPCRELKQYLISEKGLSQIEAQLLIDKNDVKETLNRDQTLWKLSPEKLFSRLKMSI